MAGPRKVKRSKRTYKKRTYKKKARRVKKTKFNTKTNARFIKKVINRTLHPEKKRYNCFRISSTPEVNRNWVLYGVSLISTDTNIERLVTDTNDAGNRSPWQWGKINKVNFPHSVSVSIYIMLNITLKCYKDLMEN